MSTPVRGRQSETDRPSWFRLQRGPAGIAGVVIAAGGCALFGGVSGILASIGVLIGGLLTSTAVGFGVALAGVLVLAETAPVVAGVVGVGLGSVFVDAGVTSPRPTRRYILGGMIGTGVALGAMTMLLLENWSLGQVAGVLTLVVSGGIYALHRYTRVVLGIEAVSES